MDKNKIKTQEQKANEVSCLVCFVLTKIYILVYGLVFIVNQKWKNQICKVGKVNDRIQILQLARSRNKRQKETEI